MGIRFNHIFWVTSLFVLFTSMLRAQDTEPDVHKINGKKYYLHIVEPKNTLYAISRKYSVTIDALLQENPVVESEGLKVNQTLLVPVNKQNKKEVAEIVQEQNFITYTVGEKETLYAISKKYSTTLEALLKANPVVEREGLKAGSSIQIPYDAIEVETPMVEPAKLDTLEGHIVEKGETIYSLSKKYNVTQEELLYYNGGLPIGLKVGMALRIPGRVVELPEVALDSAIKDSSETVIEPYLPVSFNHFDIALFLPLNAMIPDSANAEKFKVTGSNRISLNFLRGFKFALDSLLPMNDSISLDVQIYDLQRDTNAVREVMLTPEFQEVDIVIGPFFTDQLAYVADFLSRRGIPVICPIPKPSKLLFKRKNLIKTVPSETMQLRSLAEYVAHHYADSNLLILDSRKPVDGENFTFFKSMLSDALGTPDTASEESKGFKEITLWEVNYETLSMRFRDTGNYVVVIPSKDNVFVTQIIGEMYNLQFQDKGKYTFTILGMENWFNIQDNLDINHLQTLNVTLASAGRLDHNDYRVKKFFREYYHANGYEPDEFTVRGFDLGAYLVNSLTYQAELWFTEPESVPFIGIMSSFTFDRMLPNSGVEATGIKLYEYEGFRLKEISKWSNQDRRSQRN